MKGGRGEEGRGTGTEGRMVRGKDEGNVLRFEGSAMRWEAKDENKIDGRTEACGVRWR